MPGRRASIPKFALPFTLSGVSSRFVGLPIILNWLGSLSFTLVGGAILPAASARLPYVRRRFEAVCTTALFSAWHSDASTLHFAAAAAISISRAVAPA